MRRWLGRGIIVALAAFFLFLPSATAQNYTPPFPAEIAKKIGENQLVVAWEVTWQTGKSTGMHRLDLDQVSVTVLPGAVKVTRPDGSWGIEENNVGDVRYESKGTVVAKEGVALSDSFDGYVAPSRTIVFQLKDFIPPKWPVINGWPDQFPRPGAFELFETDKIIVYDFVFRSTWHIPPHMHYRQSVAVFLEGATLRTIDQDLEGSLKTGVYQRMPPNPPFVRKTGEVIGIGPGPIPATSPMKVPHEEEVMEGTPHIIQIVFKAR